MDVEHFGFLSSVIRKRESHEQDGEALRAILTRIEPASGDPAMALHSSIRLARTDVSVRLIQAAFLSVMLWSPRNGGKQSRLQRARIFRARNV
jgi:hypothetical protein